MVSGCAHWSGAGSARKNGIWNVEKTTGSTENAIKSTNRITPFSAFNHFRVSYIKYLFQKQ